MPSTMVSREMLLRGALLALLACPTASYYMAPIAQIRGGYPEGISYEPLPGAGAVPVRGGNAVFGRRLAPPSPPPSPGMLRGTTRLFLDTADEKAWGEQLPLGIFGGITTNPVLLERAGKACTIASLDELSSTAFGMGVQEFMCQAWGETVSDLVGVGGDLAKLDPRIVVKLPLTEEGITAASVLTRRGARVCMTACYAPHQVLTSAALGAEYVAPYLGRMTDAGPDGDGMNGMDNCQLMQQVLSGLGSDTRLLVASIRDASQLALLAAGGCDTFTFSPDIAKQLSGVALTRKAADEFEEAAKKMKQGTSKKTIGFNI